MFWFSFSWWQRLFHFLRFIFLHPQVFNPILDFIEPCIIFFEVLRIDASFFWFNKVSKQVLFKLLEIFWRRWLKKSVDWKIWNIDCIISVSCWSSLFYLRQICWQFWFLYINIRQINILAASSNRMKCINCWRHNPQIMVYVVLIAIGIHFMQGIKLRMGWMHVLLCRGCKIALLSLSFKIKWWERPRSHSNCRNWITHSRLVVTLVNAWINLISSLEAIEFKFDLCSVKIMPRNHQDLFTDARACWLVLLTFAADHRGLSSSFLELAVRWSRTLNCYFSLLLLGRALILQ